MQEYYDSNVEQILTTTVAELQKQPERRFTYVEIAFFAMWWKDQPAVTKDAVRILVKNGQLDFSNGALI